MRKLKFRDFYDVLHDIKQIYKYAKSPREARDPMAILVDRKISEDTVIVKTNPYNCDTIFCLIRRDLQDVMQHKYVIIRPVIGAGYGPGKSACTVICEEIAKDLFESDLLMIIHINLERLSNYTNIKQIQNELVLNKIIDKYIRRLSINDEKSKKIRRDINKLLKKGEVELSIYITQNKSFKKIIKPDSNSETIEQNYFEFMNYLMENQAEQLDFLFLLLKAFSENGILNVWLIDEYEKFFDGQRIMDEKGDARAISILENLGRFWINYTDVRLMVMITMTDEVIKIIKTDFAGFAEPYFRQVDSQNILLKFFIDEEFKKLGENLDNLLKLLPKSFSDNYESTNINNILVQIEKEKKSRTPSEFIRRFVENLLNEYQLNEEDLAEPELYYQASAFDKFKSILQDKYSDDSKGQWKNFQGKTKGNEKILSNHPIDFYAEFQTSKDIIKKRAFGEATTSTHLYGYINDLSQIYRNLKNDNYIKSDDLLFFFTPSDYIKDENITELKHLGFKLVEFNMPDNIKKKWEEKFKKRRISKKEKKTVEVKESREAHREKAKAKKVLKSPQKKLVLSPELQDLLKKCSTLDEELIEKVNLPKSHITKLISNKNILSTEGAKLLLRNLATSIGFQLGANIKNSIVDFNSIQTLETELNLTTTKETSDFINPTVARRLIKFQEREKIRKDAINYFRILFEHILNLILDELSNYLIILKKKILKEDHINSFFNLNS